MRVTRLALTNVRPIEVAEFEFQPGFNLVVGVNGVGKTTVLDALCECLRDIVTHTGQRLTRAKRFSHDDIRVAISVHVPCACNTLTKLGARIVEWGCDAGEEQLPVLEDANGDPGAAAEKHPRGAGIHDGRPSVVVHMRADDHVVEAISVDVSGARDADTQVGIRLGRVDLVIRGKDKTNAVTYLLEQQIPHVVFIGDALFEGGNDSVISDYIRDWQGSEPCPVTAISVDNWRETIAAFRDNNWVLAQ